MPEIARRRRFLKGCMAACAVLPLLARAQPGDAATVMHVRDASIARLPANAEAQKFVDSPAPHAANAGRWNARAPLPFPRSEMASAAAWNGRMHVVGGYGNLRVDRNYHHIYDAAKNAWSEAPALPRGASHIGVATASGMLYAIGGFVEQNRLPHDDAFVFDIGKNEWRAIAPLPRARAASCVVALNGKIHVIAGASGRDIKKALTGTRSTIRSQTNGNHGRRCPIRAITPVPKRSTAASTLSAAALTDRTAIPACIMSTMRKRMRGKSARRCRRHVTAMPQRCCARKFL
jgi:hypothetical protein